MLKYLMLFIFIPIFLNTTLQAQDQSLELSFDEAVKIMMGDNNSLKIADQEVQWAKTEHQRLNAFWLPKITTVGAYTHFSNKVEVRQPLSAYTNPIKELIQGIDPGEQLVTGILDAVGQNNLVVPIFPQNITTVDALLTYPLFTGGKRIYATKIGKQMVEVANVAKEQIDAGQRIVLVETYFGVRLAQRVVEVKRETYNSFKKHYQNALKLEANGMLTKTERLFFQVNRDESKRELEVARKDLTIAQNAFGNLVKVNTEKKLQPVSPLFINKDLPKIDYFKDLILRSNYIISSLSIKKDIQDNQIKIANAAYVPNIELIGKQTLLSHGVDKYLIPRSMIGVGFTWNIFDGLDREKKIRQAKIEKNITEIEKEKVLDDLNLAIDKFYTQTQIALDNVDALKTTIEMSKELVRTRQKAFAEGMATSTEVVDAELMLSKVRLTSLLAYYQFDMALINLLAICGIPETFYEYRLGGCDEDYALN